MKKTTFGMTAVVVGLAMVALSAMAVRAADRPGFETYVVRRGDTLSVISGRVFGDVKRWREILKENPQVTNANRIYPGDILLVPAPQSALPAQGDAAPGTESTELGAAPAPTDEQVAGEVAAAAAAADAADAAADAAKGDIAVPELPVEMVRSLPVVNPALYRSAGFIADGLPMIAIVASQDDRILLGTGDVAFVNAPFSPGARFTVVRATRRVYHPATREYLGWLVRILGTAEVTCRGERTSTVAFAAMNDAASVGDYLVPIDPDDVLDQDALTGRIKPECIPDGAGDGTIVAFDEERKTVGELELAYIDRGTSSGVAPGQRFTIYRKIAPEGRVTVGELQVLRAGANTATALITTSIQEIQVGYLLRAR